MDKKNIFIGALSVLLVLSGGFIVIESGRENNTFICQSTDVIRQFEKISEDKTIGDEDVINNYCPEGWILATEYASQNNINIEFVDNTPIDIRRTPQGNYGGQNSERIFYKQKHYFNGIVLSCLNKYSDAECAEKLTSGSESFDNIPSTMTDIRESFIEYLRNN